MRILDTKDRAARKKAAENLRKALGDCIDRADQEDAWEALDEPLQRALEILGLGPPDEGDWTIADLIGGDEEDE